MKCELHPKYKGKGKPTSYKEKCTCYKIWLIRQSRAPYKPTRIIESKKIYNRKRNKDVIL